MALLNTINQLKESAIQEANVNQVILYDLLELNKPDTKYSVIVIIPNNSIVSEDLITRSFTIYYIDRLTDTANQEYIQSTGELILSSILERIGIDSFTINYFKHKFLDDCAGCYANVNITDKKETLCEIAY